MHVEIEVEHFQRQFAARNNIGSLAAYPARIMFEVRQENWIGVIIIIARRKGDMHGRVENLDDLAVSFYAVGNVNRLLEGTDDRLSDGSLAVSGRAVNENRSAGVGGGTEAPNDIL